jgi:excisionase family DNA binding protein
MDSQLADELIQMFTMFVRSVERHEAAPQPPTDPQSLQRLLYTVDEAAQCLSVGRTNVFDLIRRGEIESVKIGSRRLVPRAALEAFVNSLRQRDG